jgi:hypothetical protein
MLVTIGDGFSTDVADDSPTLAYHLVTAFGLEKPENRSNYSHGFH